MTHYSNLNDLKNLPNNSLPGWFYVACAIGFLVTIIALGIPSENSQEEPPPGAKLYREGNLLCWDKVVCCNPADESTCSRIPICEIVE